MKQTRDLIRIYRFMKDAALNQEQDYINFLNQKWVSCELEIEFFNDILFKYNNIEDIPNKLNDLMIEIQNHLKQIKYDKT